MDFDFSAEQKALSEEVGRVIDKEGGTAAARQCLDTSAPFSDRLWRLAGELGWCGISIAETYGGLGMGYLELCLVAEKLGRSLSPVPFASSIYLGAEALLLGGTEDQKERYLPSLAAGEVISTACLSDAFGAGGIRTGRMPSFDNARLTGSIGPVVDGLCAQLVVTLAATAQGPTLLLVDLGQDETIRRIPNRDLDPTRPSCTLVFDGTPAQILGAAGQGHELALRLMDRAAAIFAFEQLGMADACLELAANYAKQRHAFGRPIGSFQAVKHKLANIYVANQLARSNAYFAAWALSVDAPELGMAAASARVSASTASQLAAQESIQVHGGIGFTWESDCHLYYRRAKHLNLVLGSPTEWKLRLGRTIERSAPGGST